jgi:NTE family protein
VLQQLRRRLHRLVVGSSPSREPPDTGLVLGGGGARAAYQVGVLAYVADAFPEAHFSIITGVSAGAINAAHLAGRRGSLKEAAARLVADWKDVTSDQIYEPEPGLRLLWAFLRGRIDGGDPGGTPPEKAPRGLVDTAPLRNFLAERFRAGPDGELTGIAENLRAGRLKAAALTATEYATGRSVSFVEGRDFDDWERPNRISRRTRLSVDHVMASAALPLVFPAIRLGGGWYGDGGVRLSAPLAPAVHLGADRLFVVSTRYDRSEEEAADPVVDGYPPPAQIIGMLMNAVFLDALDQDTLTLERVNRLIRELPEGRRHGMRPVDLLVLRPSVDLGRLAGDYEASLPLSLRVVTRGLGADETQSPDALSMLLFEPGYVERLLDIGYRDAERRHDRIAAFLDGVRAPEPQQRRGETA